MLDRPIDCTFDQPEPSVRQPGSGVYTQILRYSAIGWRFRYLFCSVFLLVLALGTVAVFSLKRSFMASATVVVSTQVMDPLAQSPETSRSIEDDELATQAALIESRDVAALVLKELPFPAAPPPHNWKHFLCDHGVRFGCGPATEAASNSAGAQDRQIDALLSSVTVEPQPRSRVITVNVKADTGERAAAVANAFVTNYQKLALGQRVSDLQREADWLDARTAALRQRWLEAERTASTYNAQHGLTNMGSGSPLLDRQIEDMASSLGQAEARYAAAQARVAAVRAATQGGDPQAMLSLSEEPLVVAAAGALLQSETTKAQKSGTFGPNHPDVLAADRQIAVARGNLSSATRRAVQSIGGELTSAQADVNQLAAALDRLRRQLGRQSGPQAEYRTLEQEAVSARGVYEAFLDRAKQLTDRVALLQPPIIFVSHAAVPAMATFPNRKKLMMGVIVLALVGGVSVVALRALLSPSYVDVTEMRALSGLRLLGVFPQLSGRTAPAAVMRDHPFSLTAEAVRELGAQLAISGGPARPGETKIVTVVSAFTGDGKRTLAAWLAAFGMEAGETALVIDADFGRENDCSKGFSDVLRGDAVARNVIVRDESWGGDVMGAGTPRGYTFDRPEIGQIRDLLRDLSRSYRLIIIVAPPLGTTAGGATLASIADQTIFVCRWGYTSREVMSACVERLRLYGARIAGVVVTRTEARSFNLLGGITLTRRENRLLARKRQA